MRIYVLGTNCTSSDCDAGNLSIIDAATNTVTDTLPLAARPIALSVSPNGAFIYVRHPSTETVSIIDTATKSVVTAIQVHGGFFTAPFTCDARVAFTPNSAEAYVATDSTIAVVTTATNTIISTLAGSRPGRAAKSPDGASLYVTNSIANTLAVVDTTSNTVTANIAVGDTPSDVAVTGSGTVAYVANRGSDTLSVVDLSARHVTATIRLSDQTYSRTPERLAISPDGAFAYVLAVRHSAERDDVATVAIVNTTTKAIASEIALDADARTTDIVVNSSGALAYFTTAWPNETRAAVSVLDTSTQTVVANIPVDSNPRSIALSPDGSLAYVTTFGGDSGATLDVVDTSTKTVSSAIPLTTLPDGVAVDAAGTRVYVTGANSKFLTVVDATNKTVVGIVPLPDYAGGLVVAAVADGTPAPTPSPSPNRGLPLAYVAHWRDTVSVFDGTQLTATIFVGDTLTDVAIAPDGMHAYVLKTRCESTGCDGGAVAVVDTASNTVVDTISVGGYPQRIVVAPNGARAYATISDSGLVAVIDTAANAVRAQIPVGAGAASLAISSDGGSLYVVHADMVSVVDTATNAVTTTIPVGGASQQIAVSPNGALAFVTATRAKPDSGPLTLSIIDTATRTVSRTIPFPESLGDIVVARYEPVTYVAASASCLQYVALIDTDASAPSGNIPIDGAAYHLAITPDDTLLYVAGSNSIAVVDPALRTTILTIPLLESAAAIALTANPKAPPQATPTGRVTRTPTLTPTPTPLRVQVDVGSATGAPGKQVTITVTTKTQGQEVVGVQNDISFYPGGGLVAECAVNPSIQKELTAFAYAPTGLRAIVLGNNLVPIPDGAVLYTCTVRLPPAAQPGSHPLLISRIIASGVAGESLPAIGTNGAIVVEAPPARTPDATDTPVPTSTLLPSPLIEAPSPTPSAFP